jgi:hypothetical protein
MSRTGALPALFALVLLAPAVRADAKPGRAADPAETLALLGDGKDALAGSLRSLLLEFLPSPLYEDTRHWGTQKMVTRGLKWEGQGIHVHPEKLKSAKNDGNWWRVKVTAEHLADTLVFDVRELQQPEPGRMTFTTFLSFDTDVDYDRQVWEAGTRLYSGSVRARLRVKLTLCCEVVTRLEPNGTLLPDAVFRLRILQSDFAYDNLVVEHVAGVGGEAAKLLGEAARSAMRQWHPSFERHLLEKANAAILKAGDTREVRVSLTGMLGKRK